jgi:hypothetical protein
MAKRAIKGEPRRLNKHERANFNTLMKAAGSDHLCLLSCTLKSTGENVPVVCAVNRDGENFTFVPLAMMFTGNPYDTLTPPLADEESK